MFGKAVLEAMQNAKMAAVEVETRILVDLL